MHPIANSARFHTKSKTIDFFILLCSKDKKKKKCVYGIYGRDLRVKTVWLILGVTFMSFQSIQSTQKKA
jgi:hypothetical protein